MAMARRRVRLNIIRKLSEEEAAKQIIQSVKRAPGGEAPFALVLGAGFSFGLVPTVRELVTEHLPLWWRASGDVARYRDALQNTNSIQRAEAAATFWKQFAQANANRGLDVRLSPSGVPENLSDAYQAAFSPDYDNAVGAPADARRFQRELVRLDRFRLNASHFLLASLLGVQPGRSKRSLLFDAEAAFSRLILTTNFDPFLQIALQAVNRLYFMSDTPDLGVSDEIFDDHTDAIHLVYLHGSVHRRAQAATEHEIREVKEKNARILAPILKRRGVIVLGYSGWDDAIVEALDSCNDFDYRLYWCGRVKDPLTRGAFGPRVPNILRKRSAYYVLTEGAGRFMLSLHNGLVKRLPRLLENPIGQMRDMLQNLDLSDLGESLAVPIAGADTLLARSPDLPPAVKPQHLVPQVFERTEPLESARLRTIDRLLNVELLFQSSQNSQGQPAVAKEEAEIGYAQVSRILERADLAAGLGNYVEVENLCSEVLSVTSMPNALRYRGLMLSGRAKYMLGNSEGAVAQATAGFSLDTLTENETAELLLLRGIALVQSGRFEDARQDFSRIVETNSGASVELRARALLNRGRISAENQDSDLEIADYTRVIEEMPGASSDTRANALLNRASALSKKRRIDAALADFASLALMKDISHELTARALINRGFLLAEKERQREGSNELPVRGSAKLARRRRKKAKQRPKDP
jgi:tetratricopeptide (TPR) repeat protein